MRKIVVFDLDETLGYFMELGMFWDALKSYINLNNISILPNQELFNKILDLYPEFLRPNITEVLNYIKKKKEQNNCDKLMIYTNNQGPAEWVKFIITYFETKIGFKIFDQIIGAFKIQGQKVELCRTTTLKNHKDLIRCTKIPENTQICFLDDVYYPDMANDRIYYINVKPYIHDLSFDYMIAQFINSNIIENLLDDFTIYILRYLKRYNYIYVEKSEEAQLVDIIVSKKILEHLHTFFKIKYIKPKTKRKRIYNNKTIKTIK